MKRILVVITFIIPFAVTVAFVGCSSSKSSKQNTSSQSNTASNSANKTFTVDDLKKYNGQNGQPAYVAVNGTVYDVTNARKWRNGKHEQGIVAGVDLTNMMGQSPHGNSVLADVPIVGKLQ